MDENTMTPQDDQTTDAPVVEETNTEEVPATEAPAEETPAEDSTM